MKIAELLAEEISHDKPVTRDELNILVRYLDRLWERIMPASGIKTDLDTRFSSHFLDRVNDDRNNKQITLVELGALFKKAYETYGKKIVSMGPNHEAVLKDMRSDVNIPFVLTWDRDSNNLELIAKTVMRKRGFKSSSPALVVEKTG